MSIFRYFLCAGSMLLAALLAVGESGGAETKQVADSWTSTDSLRSMAHHGEATYPRFRNPKFLASQ